MPRILLLTALLLSFSSFVWSKPNNADFSLFDQIITEMVIDEHLKNRQETIAYDVQKNLHSEGLDFIIDILVQGKKRKAVYRVSFILRRASTILSQKKYLELNEGFAENSDVRKLIASMRKSSPRLNRLSEQEMQEVCRKMFFPAIGSRAVYGWPLNQEAGNRIVFTSSDQLHDIKIEISDPLSQDIKFSSLPLPTLEKMAKTLSDIYDFVINNDEQVGHYDPFK